MKILYVNSGLVAVHGPLDYYIATTLKQLVPDVTVFDLTTQLLYYKQAGELLERHHQIPGSDSNFIRQQAAANLLFEVVTRQKPDVVLTMHGMNFSPELRKALQGMGIRTALWAVDDPYEVQQSLAQANGFDLVFTVEKDAVPLYLMADVKEAYHLPLGVYPGVFKKEEVPPEYRSDICFIGSAFYNRLELIDEVAEYLVEKKTLLIGQWWDKLGKFQILKGKIRNQMVPPVEAARFYNGAKINLNLSRASNAYNRAEGNTFGWQATSPNNRTFEIAACQAFQLVDASRDLTGFYKEEQEVVTFSGTADLIQKMEFYLSHPEEREAVAQRAYQRTINEHTYEERLKTLLNTLEKSLGASKKGALVVTDKPDRYYEGVNPYILSLVPSNVQRVLDVGCGSGLLGKELKAKGVAHVTGIEINPEAANRAKVHLDRVLVGDVEKLEVDFSEGEFDWIIFGDVLEHLRDPWQLLNRYRRYLSPAGQVVASIPNVAYFEVIKGLLGGQWNYTQAGVLDATHLRFFTLLEIKKLFSWTGYKIVSAHGIQSGIVSSEEVDSFVRALRSLGLLNAGFAEETFIIQYLVVASPADADDLQEAAGS
ncbi:MAG: glycosyltransferase [Firmicutes bacterium]|nr:glycosyltransferase [Bacillota bacterium]MCL5040451.1 glycosyltransferase [Bacillota bacterium]